MNGSNQIERRERKDARRNQERVLQAAHELFIEYGHDVTMEAVARRAGVGIGTIYRRFPSKEHLFAAVSQAVCSDTQHHLEQAMNNAPDPLSKLRTIVYVQYCHSAKQAPLLNLHPQPLSENSLVSDNADHQGLYPTLHSMLCQVIVAGQCQGIVRQGDPEVLAAICLELVHPRAFSNVQQVIGGQVKDIAEHVAQFVLYGLCSYDE